MFSFTKFTAWIDNTLHLWFSDFWVLLLEFALIGVALLVAYAALALALIYIERKVCAYFQCRIGPDRVGFKGIFQTVADMIKILLKELIHLDHIDHFLFRVASFIVIIGSICTFAALPFAKSMHALDFNIGVFYILAVSSLGVIGILLAGWSSNSKYTMVGAMRSGAQLISYEISSGLSVITIVILAGSMQISEIVAQQADLWFIFKGHVPAVIAFFVYIIAGHAETNRGPFDLSEAESELTAGYHTEYSGIQFGFFYIAEYMNMFIVAAVASTLFFGGWQPLHIPGWEAFNGVMDYIPSMAWFFLKTFACVFIAMWVRWSFPRLRIDQLLGLEWKILMPVSIINLILMSLLVIL
jgi:NADH-quinone oxidoreductase subunit H